jgi:hypothetical protein
VADEGDKTYTQEELDAILSRERDALKANRDEALKEAKRAKEQLRSYEGVDPEEYQKLKRAAEEAERKKAESEGDFKKLETQLVERHKQEMSTATARAAKLQAALEKRLVQAELTKAIAAKRGDADLLLPHAERYVRVRETEEDFVAFVADEHGNPLVADGQGTPMTFDQLVEQTLMAKFPNAFEGTGSSGGGASRSAGGAGGVGKSIAADDSSAFLANLEAIATGKVEVR